MEETYRNLIAWQKAMQLVRDVYKATSTFPKEEVYGLTAQLRRSAVSIPSNIAEGKGRYTKRDLLHFLMQARGSLFELETQLLIAVDLMYLSHEEGQPLMNGTAEVGRILNGLVRTFRGSCQED